MPPATMAAHANAVDNEHYLHTREHEPRQGDDGVDELKGENCCQQESQAVEQIGRGA